MSLQKSIFHRLYLPLRRCFCSILRQHCCIQSNYYKNNQKIAAFAQIFRSHHNVNLQEEIFRSLYLVRRHFSCSGPIVAYLAYNVACEHSARRNRTDAKAYFEVTSSVFYFLISHPIRDKSIVALVGRAFQRFEPFVRAFKCF